MADRKGKARAWSAARARATWEREFPFAHMCDMRTCEAHLAKAYLAGIKAAHDESGVVFGGTGNREEWLEVFHHAESVRLGMSPQAKRKGKSGEGRDNA